MGTTIYFEEELFPTDENNGRADRTKDSVTLEVFVSNYFGDDQIYLKLVEGGGEEKIFHLTKRQAEQLSEGLDRAESFIGYDNT